MAADSAVQRRIALYLATLAGRGGREWRDTSGYIKRHLAAHASAGGVLGNLVTDTGFLGAADPSRLVPELATVVDDPNPNISGAARAYLRLGADRIGHTFAQRIANLAVASAAEEPQTELRLDDVRQLLPWTVRFALGRQAIFDSAQRPRSQDLVTLATGVVAGRPVIVTSDLDYRVHVWDGQDGHFRGSWNAHRGVIRAMTIAAAGDTGYLVTGSTDKSLGVWDLSTGDLVRRIVAPSPITCLTLDPGDPSDEAATLIFAGSQDGALRTWDLNSGNLLAEFPAHADAVASVTHGWVGGVRVIASGGLDRNVRLWNARTGRRLLSLRGPTGSILSIVVARVDDHDIIATANSDESVWVWDAQSGEQRAVLLGHAGTATSIALWEGGEGRAVLASGSADMTVRLWDLRSGECLGVLAGHLGGVRALSTISEAVPVLVSGSADRTFRVWDAVTGEGLAPATASRNTILPRAEGGIWAWGDSAISGQADQGAHAAAIRCVRFGTLASRDVLVSGSLDGELHLHDASAGTLLRRWRAHTNGVLSVDFTTVDGRVVIVSGGHDYAVRCWDAETGQRTHEFAGHTRSVWGVAAGHSADGPVAVSGSRDRTVRIWSLTTGEPARILRGPTERVWGVACGELDSTQLVAAASTDRTVWLWNLDTGEALQRFTGAARGVRYVKFARLLDRPAILASAADGTILIWDLATGAPLRTLRGHSDGIWNIAVGTIANRVLVASASDDMTVRLWDIEAARSVSLPQTSPAYSVDLSSGRIAIGTDRHLLALTAQQPLADEMTELS